MTSQPWEPRARRPENDVTAIYELLGEIQVKVDGHDLRFDAVDARLDGLSDRVDGLSDRVDGLSGRVDGLSGQVTEVLEILRAR